MFEIFAKSKKMAKVSFRETLDLAGIPIITFKNNGHKYNFILDTGATTSLINSSVVNELVDKISIPGQELIYGLDNNVEFKGKKYNIKFTLLDEVFYIKLCSMDLNGTFGAIKQETGATVHGLLGSDFLEANKYILDYNKMIAYHK